MDRHAVRLAVLLLALLLPAVAQAYAPAARFNLVPYQRIPHGGSLAVGVVAFGKPGIDRVEFSATGQGYSGGTKTATTMTLNSASNTWEYWVSFAAAEFSGNGAVTISATAFDELGNSRSLTLPLIAEGASGATPPSAWAAPGGNNSTCVVGSEAAPCQTIAGAVAKIQAANGGSAAGATIYLQGGTYSLGNQSTVTTGEWLTITRDPDVAAADVVINAGGSVRSTALLRLRGVTVQSTGGGQYVFETGSPTNLWLDGVDVAGSGRWVANSNPVHVLSGNLWATDCTVHDVDYGFYYIPYVRGCAVDIVGNDPYVNTQMIVNSSSSNISNGATGWHADSYQTHTTGVPAPSNRIIYNYRSTNVHYEGLFMRSDAGMAQDNAFVNVLVELREPADRNESDAVAFMAIAVSQSWDHLLIWNSTFLTGHGEFYGTYTNSSLVGSLFYQFVDDGSAMGTPALPEWAPGNSSGNEALHNHFLGVYGETPACTKNSRYLAANPDWPCPHWYAKRPDSGSPATFSEGDGVLDIDYTSPTLGYPQGSVLVSRFAPRVPVDLYNVSRGDLADIGAVESTPGGAAPPALSGPTVAGVSETTATLGATVTSEGDAAVSARGVVWDIASAPRITDHIGFSASPPYTAATFSGVVTGLPAGTLIYFAGYATNANGTSYSVDGSFTTGSAGTPDPETGGLLLKAGGNGHISIGAGNGAITQ